ncbi:MAG: hypothetical protein V1773_06510 [bacterium]
MEELKSFCELYIKWKNLTLFIEPITLSASTVNKPAIVVGNCKSLIESICQTILSDLGKKVKPSIKIHELMQQTCNELKISRESNELIRSFVTVTNRLGEIRNNSYIEHGIPVGEMDDYRKKITPAVTSFLIKSIEQLAIFLINVYQQEYPSVMKSTQKFKYEDNKEFNDSFDNVNEGILIGEYGPYSASEVLFNIEVTAYNTELQNYKMNNNENTI